MGKLTTHILDTSLGKPSLGIKLELFSMANGETKIAEATTNADGRVDSPLLEGAAFAAGSYQLVFHTADYFNKTSGSPSDFLTEEVIRFNVANPHEQYHEPLLLTPYGYSTYRGS